MNEPQVVPCYEPELHGIVRTKFTGTNAELLRQRAIGFRRKRGLPES